MCSSRVGSVQNPSREFVLCPPREFLKRLVRRLVECLPHGFKGCVLHGLVLYRMVPRFSKCIPPRRGAHPPSRALQLAQRMWFSTYVLRLPPKMQYLSRGRQLNLLVATGVLFVHGRGHLRGRSRHQVGAGVLRFGGRRACTGNGK